MKISRTGTAKERREALAHAIEDLCAMAIALEDVQDREDEARYLGETLVLPPERMEDLLTAVANLDHEVTQLVRATTKSTRGKAW